MVARSLDVVVDCPSQAVGPLNVSRIAPASRSATRGGSLLAGAAAASTFPVNCCGQCIHVQQQAATYCLSLMQQQDLEVKLGPVITMR